MSQPLERLERRIIRIPGYRWIDLKAFRWAGQADPEPREVLASLIAHQAYRDHYASPESETEAPIHGKYRLEAISVDSFEDMSGPEADRILRMWVEQFGHVDPGQVEGNLDDAYGQVRDAKTLFHLSDLGKTAEHEWGWVLGRAGFHEFVLVEPAGLTLLVASDD